MKEERIEIDAFVNGLSEGDLEYTVRLCLEQWFARLATSGPEPVSDEDGSVLFTVYPAGERVTSWEPVELTPKMLADLGYTAEQIRERELAHSTH